jgi:hypothetical protein
MRLKARVAQLEKKLPAPLPADPMARQRRRRLRLVEKRLGCLLQGALQIMSAAEQDRVTEALQQWLEKQQGPFSHWFNDLAYGNCRLPELPAPVMKDLLLAWLSGDVDDFAPVCRQCGLEYPHRRPPMTEWKLLPGKRPFEDPPPWYDLSAFFQCCPLCGASNLDFDWSHLVRDLDCPWMKRDGYASCA